MIEIIVQVEVDEYIVFVDKTDIILDFYGNDYIKLLEFHAYTAN